jgi:hypothetical protein
MVAHTAEFMELSASGEGGKSRGELRLVESQQNPIVGLILAVTNPESVDAFISKMS